MSAGKSSGSSNSTTIPSLSPEQNAMIAAQTGLFTGTVAPNYQAATQGATNLYNAEAPDVTNAANNLAGVNNQIQNVEGSLGSNSLNTGINALSNLDSPQYQQQQLEAALAPGEAQYQTNLANLNNQFGGAGEMGSARNQYAATNLAGTAQQQQDIAAAGVLNNIANQQLTAGSSLAGIGQNALTGTQNAAANELTASMAPQNLYNQYASVLFGTPSASYNPNFSGTQSVTTSGTQSQNSAGFNLLPSDINLKENIVYVGHENGHKMYHFNYIGDTKTYKGVMAQDVEKYYPEAVVKGNDGFLRVNYNKLGITMTAVGE